MKYLNIGADFLLRSRVTLKPTFDVLLVLFSIQFLILEYLSIQQCTQGLIKTLGSMVIFDENKGVSDLSKYEFLCQICVKLIKFLVI